MISEEDNINSSSDGLAYSKLDLIKVPSKSIKEETESEVSKDWFNESNDYSDDSVSEEVKDYDVFMSKIDNSKLIIYHWLCYKRNHFYM